MAHGSNDEELHRDTATAVLDEARKAVGEDRGPTHGTMHGNFEATAGLWSAYLSSKFDKNIMLEPMDAAQMMVLLKVSRTIHGDPAHADHYTDMAGYSAIAGALAINGDKG